MCDCREELLLNTMQRKGINYWLHPVEEKWMGGTASMESFGGKKPYLSDFEIADDLTPDPFSEEPMHTLRHVGRESLQAENLKKRKKGPKQGLPRAAAGTDVEEG